MQLKFVCINVRNKDALDFAHSFHYYFSISRILNNLGLLGNY